MRLLSLAVVALVALAQSTQPSYPSAGASVERGATVYAQSCASCHGAGGTGTATAATDFSEAAWSGSLAPAQVVELALGQSGGHPAALDDVGSAWDATAFVWTLPLNAATVREGQAEVQQAAELLKKGGLGLLITKGGEIREIQDPNWVMQHTAADIVKLVTDLAADEYAALNAEHQQALVDYVYASHFTLPEGW